MHPTLLLSSLLVAAAAVSAGVLAPRQRPDPHRADFRTFGAEGCSDANYGVATLTRSQTNRCYKFPDQRNYPVYSVFANNADTVCTLVLFEEADCSGEGTASHVKECQDTRAKAYMLSCWNWGDDATAESG